MTIQANVSSFGAGCACNVPTRGGTTGGALTLVLAGVSITGAGLRRRR